MTDYRATVVGSYPRNIPVEDTMKKATISDDEALEMIRWAVEDQVSLGLDIVGDGDGYRENMYWFYQKRMDGISKPLFTNGPSAPLGLCMAGPPLVGCVGLVFLTPSRRLT